MKVLVILVALLVSGCAVIIPEHDKRGHYSLSYIFVDHNGCADKVAVSGRKLFYHKCF